MRVSISSCRPATHVGRILKGERPENLPVQEATTYAMVLNLNTAKALNIVVSAQLPARADEMIE